MNNRTIRYCSPEGSFPFVLENGRLYPNLEGIEDGSIDTWLSLYAIEAPEGLEVRYDTTRGIEFYAETITMSGVYLDRESGKLSIDLDSLETVIAQIPYRKINFVNTAQTEKSEATNE